MNVTAKKDCDGVFLPVHLSADSQEALNEAANYLNEVVREETTARQRQAIMRKRDRFCHFNHELPQPHEYDEVFTCKLY